MMTKMFREVSVMIKRLLSVFLVLGLVAGLCACGDEAGAVPVQRADQLLIAASAGERYAAMVVSEDVTDIQRDPGKSIAELYVAVGDEVKAGDQLFSYDLEALELEHEKQLLELEKMKNEQTGYAEQLTKLEQQLARTWNEADKSRLTFEINSLKTTQLENDYQIIAKENSIADLEATLANVDVVSPVDGTVRSVNGEEGAQSYISIQQEGAYRVKGSLNEMNMGSGLMPGVRVRVCSRVDDSVWEGSVLSIDVDQPQQGEGDYWYGAMDPMTSTSSYVFFVEMDSVEGLLLGQHVYVELAPPEEKTGLWIPESFLMNMGFDETNGNMTATVWVEGSGGKLEERVVTLGAYDGMSLSYEMLSGLSAEDYVADPADPDCAAGSGVSRRSLADFSGEG